MNLLRKLRGFIANSSHSRTVAILAISIILVAIPLTVLMSQKQQEIRQRAAGLKQTTNPQNQSGHVAGEVIVKFKEEADIKIQPLSFSIFDQKDIPSSLKIMNENFGLQRIEKVFPGKQTPIGNPENIYKLSFDKNKSVDQAIREISQDPEVEYVIPNYIAEGAAQANDPYYPQQWGLMRVQTPQAWDINTGSSQTIVAIVDSGIDYTHEDLPQDRIIKGWDFVNNDSDPLDDHGHGTHIAGIIGALTNNNIGISGINWQTKIMAVKVLGADNRGTWLNVADGILYAADHEAIILNVSIVSPHSCDPFMQYVINQALAKKVIIVTGAGNNNLDASNVSPGSCVGVINVGAADQNDNRALFPTGEGSSNYGSAVDISAPGYSVISTIPGNQYGSRSGTSMAAAYVSAAASLLLAKNPNFTSNQIKNILQETADPIITDLPIGKRLNIYKALSIEINTFSSPTPIPTPSLPLCNSTGGFTKYGEGAKGIGKYICSSTNPNLGEGCVNDSNLICSGVGSGFCWVCPVIGTTPTPTPFE